MPRNTLPSKPTPHPLAAAQPRRQFFDPWNSSSTGHQHAEDRLAGTTEWRDHRTTKLQQQLRRDVSRDGRMQETVRSERGRQNTSPTVKTANCAVDATWKFEKPTGSNSCRGAIMQEKGKGKIREETEREGREIRLDEMQKTDDSRPEKQIFRGLTIYINGSTYPLVSDHKLKCQLVSRGARLSIAMGRRSVTHVILGTPVGANGAGGGLAGGKIQKEISLVRGKSLKFVTAEWAVESLRAGRRLPESRFLPLKLAPKRQLTVREMLEDREEDKLETVGKGVDDNVEV